MTEATMNADAARVEGLWIKRAHRGELDPSGRVLAVEDKGIEGDACFGRKLRQVTIIEREVFDDLKESLPGVGPEMRRANVMVSGVRLAESGGKLLALGDVRIRIVAETKPCGRMEEARPGLQDALRPEWRGGAYGKVETGGEIAVGSTAGWADE